MPWSQTSPMDQRTQFIADYLREVLSVTELCALYGVSRKTAYKWIERYLRQGPAGLEERSRRPHESPNRTAEEIVAAIGAVGLVGAPRRTARAHRAGQAAAERAPRAHAPNA